MIVPKFLLLSTIVVAVLFPFPVSGQQEKLAPSAEAAKSTHTPCMMKNLTLIPIPKPKERLPANLPREMTPEMVANIARSSDWDCDGISNFDDKCINFASKNNIDSDDDGWGDPCDKISSDLAVAMIASRKQVRVGGKIHFRITIINHGPTEEALGIHVMALFSRSLRIDSIKVPDAAPDSECDEMDGGLLCDMLPLSVGKWTVLTVFTTAVKVGNARTSVGVENGIGDLYRKNNKSSVRVNIR